MIKKLSTLIVACALAVLPVISQDGYDSADSTRIYVMPSITVSTTKADEETPVPFNSISKSTIENNYTAQDIPAFLAGQPSVIFFSEAGNGIGYSNLTMRGFNQRRISVMINGIPQNDPEDHNVYWIDFPDIASNLQSIEIQRGAGLINYGSAAIGGSINLTTSSYLDRKGIFVSSGVGFQQFGDDIKLNVNKQSVEYSSGLGDNYAFYGRLSRIYSNGYRDRSWTEMNSYFLSAVRFDDLITTQLNIFGGPITDGLAYGGSPKQYSDDLNLRRQNLSWWSYDSTGMNVDYTQERSKSETERFSQPHFELLNDFRLGDTDNHFLSSLFYYQGDGYFDYDGSWADTTMLRITTEQGFSPTQNPAGTIIRGAVENKHGGWIPRLILEHDNGELLLGGEIRFHRSYHYGKISYAAGLPDDFDQDFEIYSYRGIRNIWSAFARERYKVSEELMLYGELQFSYQNYAIDREKEGNRYASFTSVDGRVISDGKELFNIAYTFLNPRLGVNYKIDTKNNIYGFAAITNREPRMRNLYAADDSYFGAQPLFEGKVNQDGSVSYDFSKPLSKPEQMLDIEAGWSFRNEHLNLSVNAYWMDYSNELVKSGQVDIFGNPIEGNADKTRHYGLELSASLVNVSTSFGNFSLSGNLTVSRNKIIRYKWIISKSEDGELNTVSLDGNDIAGFPDVMGNLALLYRYNNLNLSITYHNVGSFRTDNFGDMIRTSQDIRNYLGYGYYSDNTLESYNVVNANLSWSFFNIASLRSIKLILQANNLLNKLYNAGAEGKDFFPAAERNFYLGFELGI